VLELRDLPVPDPGPGEVVVDVRAIGANPVDWKIYSDGLVGTDVSLALLPDTSRFVTIAAPARAVAEGRKAIGSQADPGVDIRVGARAKLVELAGKDELEVTADRTFPLAEDPEAHRSLQTGHAREKVVLIPENDPLKYSRRKCTVRYGANRGYMAVAASASSREEGAGSRRAA
jgi:NADPH:quinone reductase-like Zn-dependent oxidoreductase